MAWLRKGDKPLSEPMIAYFTDAYMHRSASMSWIDGALGHTSNQNHVKLLQNLTHWGRVTHICVSKLAIIGSDNGLSPERRQANIWTNAGILLIGTLGTNFSEILSEIHTFSLKKMHLKASSAKRRPFCLCLNVLIIHVCPTWEWKSSRHYWNCRSKQPCSVDIWRIVFWAIAEQLLQPWYNMKLDLAMCWGCVYWHGLIKIKGMDK